MHLDKFHSRNKVVRNYSVPKGRCSLSQGSRRDAAYELQYPQKYMWTYLVSVSYVSSRQWLTERGQSISYCAST